MKVINVVDYDTRLLLVTDGHMVHIGCTVEVRWLGVWYQGTVTKIGPKRNLCKVRRVAARTYLRES